MSEPRKIEVFSEPYKEQVNLFVAELIEFIQKKKDYPIYRIFRKLPLSPENEDTESSISARGNLSISENTISNEGELINATFNDAAVGEIQITLLTRLEAQSQILDDGLTLDFSISPVPVTIFSQDYELHNVTFKSSEVTYLFKEAGDQTNQILLIAKLSSITPLTQSPEEGYSVLNLLRNGLLEDSGCGGGVVEPSDGGGTNPNWDVRQNQSDKSCYVASSKSNVTDDEDILDSFEKVSEAEFALDGYKRNGTCR